MSKLTEDQAKWVYGLNRDMYALLTQRINNDDPKATIRTIDKLVQEQPADLRGAYLVGLVKLLVINTGDCMVQYHGTPDAASQAVSEASLVFELWADSGAFTMIDTDDDGDNGQP